MKYVIQLLETEVDREETHLNLKTSDRYSDETNEAIIYNKPIHKKRLKELSKALKILKG